MSVKWHVKFTSLLILKILKIVRALGKLVIACEDGILNVAETSLFDKKNILKKSVTLFTLFR